MAKTNTKAKRKNNNITIYFVLSLILAVVTVVFLLLLSERIINKDPKLVSLYLAITIIIQTVFQGVLFLVYNKARDRIRITIIGLLYIAGAVVAFLANNNYILFYVANMLVVAASAVNQFLLIEKEKTKKGAITNIILGVALSALCIALFLNMSEENKLLICYLSVVIFALDMCRKLLFPSLRFEKIKMLTNILVETHAIDVLVGLIALIIIFSFIFPLIEPNITNFWDGVWYSFAVVTTIGFGDFYATTIAGRILTVILGIYGIVVVSIITSVIVNYYNEVSASKKKNDRNFME